MPDTGPCLCLLVCKGHRMWMGQATDHLSSIIAVHDNICFYGHTPKDPDWHLLQLMQTAKQHGIVFNSSKCQIRLSQITFYSAVFTAQGMQPDPAKIQALQDLPTPNSRVKLQSSLGLINYLQPFIPSLFTTTTFLCKQLAEWDWNPSTDTAFQQLKAWICQTLLNTTLTYYNRSKPVILQTDASEYGLGDSFIQSGCPITFTSKTLTDIEISNANIERECQSVCFSLKKFHTYLYGRHVTIQNDHKPLEMIEQKPSM